MHPYLFRLLVMIVVLISSLGGCQGQREPTTAPFAPPMSSEPETTNSATPADLEQRIRYFCGTVCHAYPPPDTFPQEHWRMEVERAYGFFERSGLALTPPRMSDVIRYYEERAPLSLPVITPVYAKHRLPMQWEPVSCPLPPGGGRAMISHVQPVKLPPGRVTPEQIAAAPTDLLACDMQGGRILLYHAAATQPSWQVLGTVRNPARACVVDLDGDNILDVLVADLGSFPPTNQRCGRVVWLRGQADGTYQPHVLLENVGRVADVRAAPFRQANRLDLVVAVFGLHEVGEVLLLENQTTDWNKPHFVPRQLDGRTGAIHVPVIDLNEDGRPDFIALFAQEHETIVAFLNEGQGRFRKKTLYSAPHPGWGSSGIELTDINGDGRPDILYTNGDILDEPYLWKPYHGLGWLENLGDLRFEYHRIGDMYGIHHAVAAPLCGGPLPDILAVSFLPADKFRDREARQADAVVLFRQVAPGQFE
ncbi:MAG: VCBS repeat-containing protein, partial [Gemmataceae bacterium]|nr:VCBS repeat-containing protein [Gemmataceae bacterium]